MKYTDVLKNDPRYEVSQEIFESEFEKFKKSYSGEIKDFRDNVHMLPAWRAFMHVKTRGASVLSKSEPMAKKSRFGSRKSDANGEPSPDSTG